MIEELDVKTCWFIDYSDVVCDSDVLRSGPRLLPRALCLFALSRPRDERAESLKQRVSRSRCPLPYDLRVEIEAEVIGAYKEAKAKKGEGHHATNKRERRHYNR